MLFIAELCFLKVFFMFNLRNYLYIFSPLHFFFLESQEMAACNLRGKPRPQQNVICFCRFLSAGLRIFFYFCYFFFLIKVLIYLPQEASFFFISSRILIRIKSIRYVVIRFMQYYYIKWVTTAWTYSTSRLKILLNVKFSCNIYSTELSIII